MTGDQIFTYEGVIRSLPAKVVIDHLGRIAQPDGTKHPAFAAVRRMLDEGRTWVKVTEPYEDSKLGPPYADSSEVARAYVQARPERILWGTDWPHPTQRSTKPDDALLLDLLADWAPDRTRRAGASWLRTPPNCSASSHRTGGVSIDAFARQLAQLPIDPGAVMGAGLDIGHLLPARPRTSPLPP